MSSRLNLRQLTVSAVALACGALLAFGGGVAQASYIPTESFPVGAGAEGLAIDLSSGAFSGDLYDAEGYGFSQPNDRVGQSTPPFEALTEPSNTAFGGGTETEFSGVAVDSATGNVYALATAPTTALVPEEDQVDVFDPSSGAQIPAIGAGTISAGDHARIWIDSSGDVFVPDVFANVVYKFTPSGPGWTASTIGSGKLSSPRGVAVDSSGNVYVVDEPGSIGRVQEFSSTGVLEGTLAGLTSAEAVTVSVTTNEVFVVDRPESGRQVDVFAASQAGAPGTQLTTFGSGDLPARAPGIALDASSHHVYVVQLSRFPPSTVVVFEEAVGPGATTEGFEAVTATTATVSGTVSPNGFATHWYFEFGPSQTYGEFSPAPPGSETAIETTVQTTLTGLQPSKTYHYQLIASNPNGSADGGDRTVTTSAVRPLVDAQSSSATTQTGATVNAQINPNNQPTTYQFQYGTDINYTLGSIPASPAGIGSGFGDQAESATLAGLQPNTLYHYRVVAINATGITEGVDHTFTTLPNAPSALTGAASGLGQSAATLTGTIDPQGAQTSYYFEYSGPGAFSIVSGEAGSGSGATTVTVPVNGLTAGTTYQYRLIATNAGGTTSGSYQTFTTAPPPPSGPPAAVTGGTSNLTPSSATLSGSVDPNGGATSYEFQYGTSAAYGASLSEASAGSGAEPDGVAAGLSSLAAGTSYHYRLVATNAAGTSYGADQTFTTPAAPVSVFGPPPVNTIALTTTTKPTTPKPLTRAQKLSKALKACNKDKSKAKRAKCEKEARKKYGTKAKRKN